MAEDFIYQDIIDELDVYFSKIVTDRVPETEDEFWHTIEFLGFNILWDAMAEAQSDDSLDELSEVQKNSRMKAMIVKHESMVALDNLVSLACVKFNLSCSSFVENPEEGTFQRWFIERAQECNCGIKYSLLLFGDVHVVDNPQYPV